MEIWTFKLRDDKCRHLKRLKVWNIKWKIWAAWGEVSNMVEVELEVSNMVELEVEVRLSFMLRLRLRWAICGLYGEEPPGHSQTPLHHAMWKMLLAGFSLESPDTSIYHQTSPDTSIHYQTPTDTTWLCQTWCHHEVTVSTRPEHLWSGLRGWLTFRNIL